MFITYFIVVVVHLGSTGQHKYVPDIYLLKTFMLIYGYQYILNVFVSLQLVSGQGSMLPVILIPNSSSTSTN